MGSIPAAAENAGNTWNTATPLAIGRTFSGTISSTNEYDYFVVTLPSSGKLTLDATTNFNAVYFYIYDAYPWYITEHSLDDWNEVRSKGVVSGQTYLNSGTYYLIVSSNNYGNYSLKLSFESSGESFKESYRGNNDTFDAASPIKVGNTYKGVITDKATDEGDDYDWYTFTLPSSGKVTLNATTNFDAIYFSIYDAYPKYIVDYPLDDWNGARLKGALNTQTYLNAGTYYLVVSSSNYGNYTFTLRGALSVTFDNNYKGGGMDLREVTSGNSVGTLPVPKRKGYSFAGWWTAPGGGTQITKNTKVSKTTVYYAHWTIGKYTVKFNVNKGKALKKSLRSKTVTYAQKYGKLPTPKRKGYKFKGWYTKKSGGKRITSASKFTAGTNQTLYARWKKK
jgi:uncharacterized repeat protein (TIGR02543 family)